MKFDGFEPKIINSKVEKDVFIDWFSLIENSSVLKGCNIYKMARVRNSSIGFKASVGDNTRVDNSTLSDYTRIDRLNHIFNSKLGRYSYTGQGTVVMHTIIGKFSSISWGVTIGPANHDYSLTTTHSFLYNQYDGLKKEAEAYNRFDNHCRIGNDVWIGCNATILRNVSVGDGAVIAANTLVNKDVPPYSIVAGVPAKVIKYRFDKEIIDLLLKLKWWNWEREKIKDNYNFFAKNPDKEKIIDLLSEQR